MYKTTKRILDVVLAAIGIVVLAPAAALTAILVRARMGSPVLFKQVRPGLDEKPFALLKFRTMREERNSGGAQLPDQERLSRIGRKIRALSLDEIPQLWNVLRGEMSLVGPRPLLMEYLDRYTPEQARRHTVLPGITGWAQVNGRNMLTWEEKFDLDLWYVDHCSVWLDLRILYLTLLKVVRRDGISQAGHATMPEFRGQDLQAKS